MRKKTYAVAPVTNLESNGAERGERNMARNGAAFKSDALAFLAPAALEGLETGVRAIVDDEARLPVFLSQRTAERWASFPRRDFLAAGRSGAFPTFKEGRLVYARTADVVAFIESRRRPVATDEEDDLDAALARVGGRRVGAR